MTDVGFDEERLSKDPASLTGLSIHPPIAGRSAEMASRRDDFIDRHSWRGIRVGAFERKQSEAIRQELDADHEQRHAPAVRKSEEASLSRKSSRNPDLTVQNRPDYGSMYGLCRIRPLSVDEQR